MSGRYVLDTGALLALEREPAGALARRCRHDARERRLPLVPTTVFAQAWHDSPHRAALLDIRRHSWSLPFTDRTAEAVGRLLALSRTGDVVDAAVVVAALEYDADVVTSEPDDIGRLADALGCPLVVVPV